MNSPETGFPPAATNGPPVPPREPAAAAHDALPPGAHVDAFVIERELAASGFGIVYLARDGASGERVALKEYLPLSLAARAADGAQLRLRAAAHADAFERGRRAFIDESTLLARCEHPSLVHVLHHWEANGTAYRAMPYYAGQSLLALRQAMGEPPDEASLRLLLEGLLGALDVLHAAGRIHGQIAPNKILLMPDDHPVLLGLGAARRAIVGEQTQALMMLLEPTFAPIELIAPSSGLPTGPWTDLYALAATLHYCVSGRLPAAPSGWLPEPHEPMTEVVRRLQRELPRLHYSLPFIDTIDAALSLRPRDRPQGLAEFRKMLEVVGEVGAAARDEPVFAPEPAAEPEPAPEPAAEPVLQAAPEPMPEPAPEPPTQPAEPRVEARPFVAEPPSAPAAPPRMSVDEAMAAFLSKQGPATARAAEVPPRPSRPPTIRIPFASAQRRVPAPRRRRSHPAGWSIAVAAVAGAGIVMLNPNLLTDDLPAALTRTVKQIGGVPSPQRQSVAAAPSATPPVVGAAPAPVAAPAPAPAASAAAVNASVELPDAPTAAIAPAPAPAPAPEAATAAAPAVQTAAPAPRRPAPAPVKPAPKPRPATVTVAAAAPAIGSPREACGDRTQFALFRCVKSLCEAPKWAQHAQCIYVRKHDDLPDR